MNHYLVDKIADSLNTHDKRYMFLKIFFPRSVSRINLEGASWYVAYQIVEEFIKQNEIEELERKLMETFYK